MTCNIRGQLPARPCAPSPWSSRRCSPLQVPPDQSSRAGLRRQVSLPPLGSGHHRAPSYTPSGRSRSHICSAKTATELGTAAAAAPAVISPSNRDTASTPALPDTSSPDPALQIQESPLSNGSTPAEHDLPAQPSTSQDTIQQAINSAPTLAALHAILAHHRSRLHRRHLTCAVARLVRLCQHRGGAGFKLKRARALCAVLFDLVYPRVLDFSPQDFAQLLQAAPFLPYRDQVLMDICMTQLEPALPSLPPAQLVGVAVSLSALQHSVPDTWATAWFSATCPHVPRWTPAQLSSTANSCRALAFRPPSPWLQKHVARSRQTMGGFTDESLSVLVTSYGALGCRPSPAWLQQLEAASLRRLPTSSPAALAGWAHGLSLVRHAPAEAWMDAFLAASVEKLPQFTGRQLVRVLHAFSSMRARPSSTWVTAVLIRTRQLMGDLSPEDLSTLLYSLARLGLAPSRPWVKAYCAAIAARAPFLAPSHTVNAVYGFACLGIRPSDSVLAALLGRAQEKLVMYTPEELADLLYGVSRLQHVPPAQWLLAFFEQSRRALPGSGPQLLLNCMQAVARLQLLPGPAWFAAFSASASAQLAAFQEPQLASLREALCALAAGVKRSGADNSQQYAAAIEQLVAAVDWRLGVGPPPSEPGLPADCEHQDEVEEAAAEQEAQAPASSTGVAREELGAWIAQEAGEVAAKQRQQLQPLGAACEGGALMLRQQQLVAQAPQWMVGRLVAALVPASQ